MVKQNDGLMAGQIVYEQLANGSKQIISDEERVELKKYILRLQIGY